MLDEQQAEKVRIVLQGSGWNDVMKPALVLRGNQATKALILARSERASEFRNQDFDTDDDVLRAMIRDCQWMVDIWPKLIEVYDHNRRLDELGGHNANPANP